MYDQSQKMATQNNIKVFGSKKTKRQVHKIIYEEFEDTKGVIRMRISRRPYYSIANRKSTKGQTKIYKTYT